MIKNTLLALVAVASIGAAVPAFADTGAFGDGSSDAREFTASTIVTRLQAKGFNVSSVEEWGTKIRAYVTQSDGTQVVQFFDADSLQPAS